MSLLIPELERQLRELVRARRAAPAPAPRRAARGLRGLIVVGAVLPAIVVAVLALIVLGRDARQSPGPGGQALGLAGVPQPPRGTRWEWRDAQAAERATVARNPACSTSSAHEPMISHARPPEDLLSAFAVLDGPRPRKDSISGFVHDRGFALREVYVDYIRRARSVLGETFYVVPAGNMTGFRPVPRRCTRAEEMSLRRELPGIPKARRAGVVAFQRRYLAWERAEASHPEGLAIFTLTASFSSFQAGWTIAQIDDGAALAERNADGQSLVHGLVPNGVAAVSLAYPARGGAGTVTLTSNVINNIFAAHTGRPFTPGLPEALHWYSSNGRPITIGEAPPHQASEKKANRGPGRQSLQSVPWRRAHISGRSVTVNWESGTCAGPIRPRAAAKVRERPKTVTLQVLVYVVTGGNAPCAGVGLAGTVTATLRRPVGDRKLVHGTVTDHDR